MERTKIDWCDSTWNPVTGCRHGCEYCYARRIAQRFGGHTGGAVNAKFDPLTRLAEVSKPMFIEQKNGKIINAPYPYGFDPTFHRYRLGEYAKKRGRTIFVCSMADLFGSWVPDEWIRDVFDACKAAPQHNYLFLTKNPARYTWLESEGKVPWSDNLWFGTSVTKQTNQYTWFKDKKFHWFLSIEPLLEDLKDMDARKPLPEWIIIGAETGQRNGKVIPKRAWIENIVAQCKEYGVPIFMKSSLAGIWGEQLIQEKPAELTQGRRKRPAGGREYGKAGR